MGCDIHAFVEYKENYEEDSYWRAFSDEISLGRNYFMFGCLTNGHVRYRIRLKSGIDPKGLPSGVSWEVNDSNTLYISDDGEGGREVTMKTALKWAKEHNKKFIYDSQKSPIRIENPDYHTHSWLTVSEYEAIVKEAQKISKKKDEGVNVMYLIILDLMKSMLKRGIETRLVFWFDN